MTDPVVTELGASSDQTATPAGATAAIASFDGDLDLASIEAFEEVAGSATGDAGIVIDLSGVRFIDSSGIHAVGRARMANAERGVGVELVVAPGSAVERVLDMSGLSDELNPKSDREAALAALDERKRAATGSAG